MNQTAFNRVAAGVFSTVCALQAVRLIRRVDASIAGTAVPQWASGVAALVAGSLAAWALTLEGQARGAPRIGRRASAHRLVSSGAVLRG